MITWKCLNCGHPIGEVKRYPDKIHRLTIRDTEGVTLVIVSGSAEVFCQVCAKARRWVPGKVQMQKLIRSVKGMRS